VRRPVAASVFGAVTVLAWGLFFFERRFTYIEMRLLHVALFGLWTYFGLAFYAKRYKVLRQASPTYGLLVAVAAICELIQFWTPSHDPEWRGFFASLLGVVLGREIYSRNVKP